MTGPAIGASYQYEAPGSRIAEDRGQSVGADLSGEVGGRAPQHIAELEAIGTTIGHGDGVDRVPAVVQVRDGVGNHRWKVMLGPTVRMNRAESMPLQNRRPIRFVVGNLVRARGEQELA
jgi:hypothetical protein